MDEKTIKQIADDLGVTKQAVWLQVANLPPSTVSSGVNRTILINQEGEALLRGMIRAKKAQNFTPDDSKEIIRELKHKIEMLELEKRLQGKAAAEQVRLLNEVVDDKEKQISDLLKAIDQEQQLHMATHQKYQLLLEAPKEPKSGFLGLFRRKEK